MHNVMSCTYTDGFTVNTTTQDICNSQNKHETNTTPFTNEHDKFEKLLFFYSTHDVHKFIGEQTTFLILRST